MSQPRSRRIAILTALAALALSGCSAIGGPSISTGSAAPSGSASASSSTGKDSGPALPAIGTSAAALKVDPATDPAYASYYGQKLDWKACEDYKDAECATLTVPRAWNAPGKGDIHLAMLRIKATGTSKGSLLMNPGGPGGSGIQFVGDGGTQVVSEAVRKQYDLVGFDPRGVGSSEGIRCLDDKQSDEYVAATFDMSSPEGLKKSQEWLTRIADSCKANSAPMLPVMDTLSAARDMDVMRAAVGSEKLDYLGFSYGTYLGATYADLYPKRTGRFVLDGAMDPTLTGDQISAGQSDAFEKAIRAYVTACLSKGKEQCPLTGTPDEALAQLRDFFAEVDKTPLPTSDKNRPLTGSMARSAVLMGMYNDDYWEYVDMGLMRGMKQHEGSTLMILTDAANDRDDQGHYNGNGMYSITAVNCLDHPAIEDEAWMKKEAARLAKKDPTWGPEMGYSGLSCKLWPQGPVRKPAPVHAAGSDLIVVVGTTGDPATPYAWAQSLDRQLNNSRLITFEGNGHTAYGRSGGCVEGAVDAYLLNGTPPKEGLTCS